MPNFNLQPSQRMAINAVIDPDDHSAGDIDTEFISMADFNAALFILQLGVMTATSLVDFKLQEATDGAGAGVKDIVGKAATQLTAAGSDDDKQVKIGVRPQDLDRDNDFTHVRARLTVAVANSFASVVGIGIEPRYGPASDTELASVDETVDG